MFNEKNKIIWNEPIITQNYDFNYLKSKYSSLNCLVDSTSTSYNFQDRRFVKQLTICILKEYHNVDISLSENNLIPRVPNRYVYLMWISKIIQFVKEQKQEQQNDQYNNTDVVVVDIGTGASCIYCLLGHSMFPDWKFIGTEINSESFAFASENNINDANREKIILVQIDDTKSKSNKDGSSREINEIFSPILWESQSDTNAKFSNNNIVVSICNPPFFDELTERNSEAFTNKIENTNLVADDTELFYKGGEVEFIKKMIDESLRIKKDQIDFAWFTSMIGKFSSLKFITDHLKSKNIGNFGIFEIDPSYNKKNDSNNNNYNIVRWVICWGFHGYHIPDYLGHKYNLKFKGMNGIKTTFKVDLTNGNNNKSGFSIQDFYEKYLQILEDYVKIRFDRVSFFQNDSNGDNNCIKVKTPGDVWSRSFKRKLKRLQQEQKQQQQQQQQQENGEMNASKKRKIILEFNNNKENNVYDECQFWIMHDSNRNQVIVFWSYGFNEKIFESFCGYVNRNVLSR